MFDCVDFLIFGFCDLYSPIITNMADLLDKAMDEIEEFQEPQEEEFKLVSKKKRK